MLKTNVYLSGRFTINGKIEADWLKLTGCKHRCFSYAFVHKPGGLQYNKRVEEALHVCEKKKINIMMDSGAHSLHVINKSSSKRGEVAKKKQQQNIHDLQDRMFTRYCEYVKENKHLWTFYVTLDFLREQPVIYEMQKRFRRKGLDPTPVYHGDSSIDWLKKYVDMGHRYICIGGATLHPGKHGLRYYFDRVFNFGAKHGIEYHGLAFTSLDIIMSYPWKSVDSSTWSRCAAFGMIILPDVRRKRFLNVHVSENHSSNQNSYNGMTSAQRGALNATLKEFGFDIKAMRKEDKDRHDWNGFVMSNLDKFGVVQESKRMWEKLI